MEVDIITGVPLEECLRRKSTAHICIDECVTGSYHRSSLEGLALGCLVINACDSRCASLLRQMTGGVDSSPFAYATIEDLQKRLEGLVSKWDHDKDYGTSRQWMEYAWQPAELIERNFKPLMDAAFEHAKGMTPAWG